LASSIFIGTFSNSHQLLDRPVKLSHDKLFVTGEFRNVGKIDVFIRARRKYVVDWKEKKRLRNSLQKDGPMCSTMHRSNLLRRL